MEVKQNSIIYSCPDCNVPLEVTERGDLFCDNLECKNTITWKRSANKDWYTADVTMCRAIVTPKWYGDTLIFSIVHENVGTID